MRSGFYFRIFLNFSVLIKNYTRFVDICYNKFCRASAVVICTVLIQNIIYFFRIFFCMFINDNSVVYFISDVFVIIFFYYLVMVCNRL